MFLFNGIHTTKITCLSESKIFHMHVISITFPIKLLDVYLLNLQIVDCYYIQMYSTVQLDDKLVTK